MSIVQKLKDATVPSALAAVAGVGIYYVMTGQNLNDKIPFATTMLPEWAAVGGAVFIGAEVGSLLTEFVGNKLGGGEYISMIVPPALSGLSVYGVMSQLISADTTFSGAFIVGAGGDIAGKYIYGMMNGRQAY